MKLYSPVLLDAIERERAGKDYCCDEADKEILAALFRKINEYAGTDFHYLAELDAFTVSGAGDIFSDYVKRLSSQSVKAYLLHQLIAGNIKDCDKLILDMYMDFKRSSRYISEKHLPAPAHIYVRYDNSIKKLKPKRLKHELLQLAYCPRDFFYLPFTMKMLASWKIPELKDLLILYSSESNLSQYDLGIDDDGEEYFPPVSFIKRQVRFTAIDSLKYYPSCDVVEIIRQYTKESDVNIQETAKKTLCQLEKRLK